MPGSSNGYTASAVLRNFTLLRIVTNEYTSVVLAASSSVISGASMWLDADASDALASSAPPHTSGRMPRRRVPSFGLGLVIAFSLVTFRLSKTGARGRVPVARRSGRERLQVRCELLALAGQQG